MKNNRSKSGREAVDCGLVHRKSPDDVPNGFPCRKLRGKIYLLGIELTGTAEPHPALFGSFPTGASSLADQITFELSDAGENRHDHLARVCCGVGPGFR